MKYKNNENNTYNAYIMLYNYEKLSKLYKILTLKHFYSLLRNIISKKDIVKL